MDKITVYTDGSCTPNPGAGGWAAIINYKEGINTISGGEVYTTNNRMEMKAVLEVINHFLLETDKEIIIHSDSSYVVNAITLGWIHNWKRNGWKTKQGTDVKNKDLWIMIQHAIISSQCEIKMVKVKGHVGDKFNEMVHDAALAEANKMNESMIEGVH